MTPEPRTAANFCHHYTADKERYLAKYNAEGSAVNSAVESDPLGGFIGLAGMSFQMLGSAEGIFGDLATVAPSDIASQVEQARDSLAKQADILSKEDPTSVGSISQTLLASLETSLESSDAWQQVGAYVIAHCGEKAPNPSPPSSAIGAPTSSAAPSSTASAPAPGTTLASVSGDGRVNVISNAEGSGFTVVDSLLNGNQDESYLQAYDAAGNPLGKTDAGAITGECGAADVLSQSGRLLLGEKIIHRAAQGIRAAGDTLRLIAFDAADGSQKWSITLTDKEDEIPDCTAYDGFLGDSATTSQESFNVTMDGTWAVFMPYAGQSTAIDLVTGKKYAKAGLVGTLGNWLVLGNSDDFVDSTRLTLVAPGTWSKLGSLTIGDNGMLEGSNSSVPLTIAGTGAQIPVETDGDPVGMAVTSDGNTLLGIKGNYDQGDDTTTVAFALPSLKKLWSLPTPSGDMDSLAGVNVATAVISRSSNDGSGATTLLGIDTRTGKQSWRQVVKAGAVVCALTTSQLVALTSDQLAFLNAASGQQESYERDQVTDPSSGETACPNVLAGGVSGVSTLSGNATETVMQLASP